MRVVGTGKQCESSIANRNRVDTWYIRTCIYRVYTWYYVPVATIDKQNNA